MIVDATKPVGAPGAMGTVVVVFIMSDTQPEPALFTARKRIEYAVPGESPLILIGLVVTGVEGVTQLVPLSDEYS